MSRVGLGSDVSDPFGDLFEHAGEFCALTLEPGSRLEGRLTKRQKSVDGAQHGCFSLNCKETSKGQECQATADRECQLDSALSPHEGEDQTDPRPIRH